MLSTRRFIITSLVLLCFVSAVVRAQEDCPAIVQTALEATHEACDAIGRNQACYGNVNLEATARDGVSDFTFSAPGDLADIAKVQTLQLSSMDQSAASWGVALMKVQANLPDTLPGQNVTFVLFGEVEIENQGGATTPELVQVNITAKNKVNVRSAPSTTGTIAGSLSAGQTVVADGRTEAGDWLRVQLDGGQSGWVFANLLTVDGAATTLAVVDANSSAPEIPSFGPMQAFYFHSGIGDAPCEKAPSSGILVQSPQGAARVTLEVNDVNIQLGSTVYLESCSCQGMDVIVVEGGALVTAAGVTRYVPAGSRVHIPTGDNGRASGAPEDVTMYALEQVQALPISLLGDKITVAAPLTDTELAAAMNPLPTSGQWQYELVSAGAEQCRLPPNTTGVSSNSATFEDGGKTLEWAGSTWTQVEPGEYTRETQLGSITLTLISPDMVVQLGKNSDGCPYKIIYTLAQAG